MTHIIAIHNRNNEEAWQEILKWEALHARYDSGELHPCACSSCECVWPHLLTCQHNVSTILPCKSGVCVYTKYCALAAVNVQSQSW